MESADVVIIGGGPAGLSAALILGRACRNVVIIDQGQYRNYAAKRLNGYLSRDGISPQDFLKYARSDLRKYPVKIIEDRANSAVRRSPDSDWPDRINFEVETDAGAKIRSRKLLLATGVLDLLPEIEGISYYYGNGVYHCPYCDAWEYRDKDLIALGEGDSALNIALSLLTWSKRVSACTEGEVLSEDLRSTAIQNGVVIVEQKIVKLEGLTVLNSVITSDQQRLPCSALFFSNTKVQASPLAASLGCDYRNSSEAQSSNSQRTNVPGLFLAGDVDGDVQFVIVAAAEGATAAVAINKELQREEQSAQ